MQDIVLVRVGLVRVPHTVLVQVHVSSRSMQLLLRCEIVHGGEERGGEALQPAEPVPGGVFRPARALPLPRPALVRLRAQPQRARLGPR